MLYKHNPKKLVTNFEAEISSSAILKFIYSNAQNYCFTLTAEMDVNRSLS